jgi:hypothetical protein
MRTSLTLLVVGGLSVAMFAQTPSQSAALRQSSAATKIETPHLTVTTSIGNSASTPAGRMSLFVDVTPKPRMHVYSPEQKQYIPIALTLETNPAFKSHTPVYPPAEKFFFEPLQETQLVYSKPFRIVQEITLASGKHPDTPLTIKGRLRYQACDDKVCYLPKDLTLEWSVAN